MMTEDQREIARGKDRLYWIVYSAIILSTIFLFLFAFTLSAGCVTMAKNLVIPTPEPTPIPTTIPPTPKPTPKPIPTLTDEQMRVLYGGYLERQWHFWFRENVSGYQDMRTFVTVYNHLIVNNFHYWSPSWATRFKISPERGYKYLFVFVNMYADDTNGAADVRQYGMGCDHFYADYNGTIYGEEVPVDPAMRITELDEKWDYAHVQSPVPYGYKIIQEKGTGIISAEYMGWLKGGRSNSWDGYCIYEVPTEAQEEDIKIHGRFDNLGGSVWWQLV